MIVIQNLDAMNRFCNMTESERQDIINQSRNVGSKQEMRNLVSGLK